MKLLNDIYQKDEEIYNVLSLKSDPFMKHIRVAVFKTALFRIKLQFANR